MSNGISAAGDLSGFSSVGDWLGSVFYSFPAPWRVADLEGKYYGTGIIDGDGLEILRIWETGKPSERQQGDMTNEEWAEYCCDTHYESEASLCIAQAIIAFRNNYTILDDSSERLSRLIVAYGRWTDEVCPLVSCGGRLRRVLATNLTKTAAAATMSRSDEADRRGA